MKNNFIKFTLLLLFVFFHFNTSFANIVKKIEIKGNERVSSQTIQLFSKVSLNDEISKENLNDILKNLYDTNFFKDVSLSFNNNILLIKVLENPIIENINYEGSKSYKIIDSLKENTLIKSRTSFNEILLKEEKLRLNNVLNEMGYYNANLEIYVDEKENNLVNLTIKFDLGKKAKLKRISFVGKKIFKDRKLRRIIASSEFKYWKFLTGRKYLNKNLVEFDKRLLTNFYKNNGYYNVQINSSFAKLISDNEFELIFNINANSKIYFGDLSLDLPSDFNKENFKRINKLFKKINGQPYSINSINKILEEIDMITALEQYQFINATVEEDIIEDKINLRFNIEETEKYYVKKINIYGNNVTAENVIRNQFEVDEGDPFNEILVNKSINNVKSLNFFKYVNKKIIKDDTSMTKIINVSVQEKPTGEIMAEAGFGTEGGSVGFGIRENNFIGKGITLDSNFSISTETIKGKFSVTNPNFKNTDKSIYISAEAIETDNFATTGYKTKKTGIGAGTNFEYLKDFYVGFGNSNFYEVIETNSTASERQKAQEGNYWDSFLKLDMNYDKRNQKFQTSSGYRTFYSLDLPVISDTNTIKNYYNQSHYFDLYEKNISNISFYFETAHSLNNKDIKLSERIKIPSRRLRGFESGRIGPKDGEDYIGGNIAYSINFSSTIPQAFEESQNVDFLFFIDAADIIGVDYDSSLDKNEVRSSLGLGLDWFSPIGPMNFSLALPVTKADTDKTETFRFNLGTTF